MKLLSGSLFWLVLTPKIALTKTVPSPITGLKDAEFLLLKKP